MGFEPLNGPELCCICSIIKVSVSFQMLLFVVRRRHTASHCT